MPEMESASQSTSRITLMLSHSRSRWVGSGVYTLKRIGEGTLSEHAAKIGRSQRQKSTKSWRRMSSSSSSTWVPVCCFEYVMKNAILHYILKAAHGYSSRRGARRHSSPAFGGQSSADFGCMLCYMKYEIILLVWRRSISTCMLSRGGTRFRTGSVLFYA